MHRIKQFFCCYFSSFEAQWRWYSATTEWLVFCYEALVLFLDLNASCRNVATVQVPDPEHPVCTSPNTAGSQATESSAAFCLGRWDRIWWNCEHQCFWVYCAVTLIQENNLTNYFQGTGFTGACLAEMNDFQMLLRRQEYLWRNH